MGKRKKQHNSKKKAAKIGWQTRRLNDKGVHFDKEWEGIARDGSHTGMFFERYTIPFVEVDDPNTGEATEGPDPATIEELITHIRAKYPGRDFIVGGQGDFRDNNERLFTNNAKLFGSHESGLGELIADSFHFMLLTQSNPFQAGRSTTVDIEQPYIVVRLAMEKRDDK